MELFHPVAKLEERAWAMTTPRKTTTRSIGFVDKIRSNFYRKLMQNLKERYFFSIKKYIFI
jgi:hypothetical protein